MTMSRSDIQTMLQDAITLAQSGQRTEARRLLKQIIEADPEQELAWMWLATVSTDRDERLACLERVLVLNPNNPTAQEAYAQITGHLFTPPTPAEAPLLPPSGVQGNTAALVRGGLIVITMLVFLIIAAFVLARQFVDDDKTSSRPVPTLRPVQDRPTTQPSVLPTRTFTPLPTHTPGPSPTSIWNAPPPTWTQAATSTTAPSPTLAPSSTPHPTSALFIGPYAKSATAEFVQTSDAGPATVEAVRTQAAITPTRTLTFDLQTATVKFAQTSEAATAAAATPPAEGN
jgi:hypothetical protein